MIPVIKKDIEFICTDQGAHKTVREALEAALGDKVTCGHIDCNKIQQDLQDREDGKAVATITDLNNPYKDYYNEKNNVQFPGTPEVLPIEENSESDEQEVIADEG